MFKIRVTRVKPFSKFAKYYDLSHIKIHTVLLTCRKRTCSVAKYLIPFLYSSKEATNILNQVNKGMKKRFVCVIVSSLLVCSTIYAQLIPNIQLFFFSFYRSTSDGGVFDGITLLPPFLKIHEEELDGPWYNKSAVHHQ